VPLSEHEQHLLDQIEQALYAEDPKFASIYQGKDVRTHYRHRLLRAGLGLVIGLGLLLAGVITQLIPLGVAGFVVMLAAATFGLTSWQRMTGHRISGFRDRSAKPRPAAAERMPKRSVVRRLEDRWQRRQGDR
jgi:Flp pilus assembly protein TadB